MKFEGVYVACMTPFSKEGRILLNVYEKHLEMLAEKGVDGFVICATTGEGPVLNEDERETLIERAKKICETHNKTLIVGCGSNSTEVVEEQLFQAKEFGADAGLVVTPYYNKPTPKGVMAHFEKIASREILPIIVYNNPGRTMINVSAESFDKLLQHPMIAGFKESSGNHSQWLSLSRLPIVQEKSWLAGDDDAFATTMLLGGKGIIATAANLWPEPFVTIYQAAKDKNWDLAFSVQKQILPLIQSLFIETNPAPLKYALRRLRDTETFVRLPLVEVEPSTESAILKAWESAQDVL